MKKVILLAMIFLLIIASHVSANEEGIAVKIKVVDLTEEPVSNVKVEIYNWSTRTFLGSSVTDDDGKVNLMVPRIEGPHFIQVFSFAGVDKPQSRGKELLSESRYIFESAEEETIYEIVVNEVNGTKGDTKVYKMANDSLDMARKSFDQATTSNTIAIVSLMIAVLSLFLSVGSSGYKYILSKFNTLLEGLPMNMDTYQIDRWDVIFFISIVVLVLWIIAKAWGLING